MDDNISENKSKLCTGVVTIVYQVTVKAHVRIFSRLVSLGCRRECVTFSFYFHNNIIIQGYNLQF